MVIITFFICLISVVKVSMSIRYRSCFLGDRWSAVLGPPSTVSVMVYHPGWPPWPIWVPRPFWRPLSLWWSFPLSRTGRNIQELMEGKQILMQVFELDSLPCVVATRSCTPFNEQCWVWVFTCWRWSSITQTIKLLSYLLITFIYSNYFQYVLEHSL